MKEWTLTSSSWMLITVLLFAGSFAQPTSPNKDYFIGQGKLVSIIVATRNNERHISSLFESVEASVESFLEQRKNEGKTLPSVEVVIVEFGSTDATSQKTRRYIETKKSLQDFSVVRDGNLTLDERKAHISYYLLSILAVSNIGYAAAKNIGTASSNSTQLQSRTNRGRLGIGRYPLLCR